jgi:hypothetical protein
MRVEVKGKRRSLTKMIRMEGSQDVFAASEAKANLNLAVIKPQKSGRI